MAAVTPLTNNVHKVAKALYDATKRPDAGSFNSILKEANRERGLDRENTTIQELLGFWEAIAIAAIDLTEGARLRKDREWEQQRERKQ